MRIIDINKYRKREYIHISEETHNIIWDGENYILLENKGDDIYKIYTFPDLNVIPDILFSFNKNKDNGNDVYNLFVIGTTKGTKQITNKIFNTKIIFQEDNNISINQVVNSIREIATGDVIFQNDLYDLEFYYHLTKKEEYKITTSNVRMIKPAVVATMGVNTSGIRISGGVFSRGRNFYTLKLTDKTSLLYKNYYFNPYISPSVYGYTFSVIVGTANFPGFPTDFTLYGLLSGSGSNISNLCGNLHAFIYYSYYQNINRLINLTFGNKTISKIQPSVLVIRNPFAIITNSFPVNPIFFYLDSINGVFIFNKSEPQNYLNNQNLIKKTFLELDAEERHLIKLSIRKCLYEKWFLFSYLLPLINITNKNNIFFQPNIFDYNPEIDIDLFSVVEVDYDITNALSFQFLENNSIPQNSFSVFLTSALIPNMFYFFIQRNKYKYRFKVYTLNLVNTNIEEPIVFFNSNERERLENIINKYAIKTIDNNFKNETDIGFILSLNSDIVYNELIEDEIPYYVRTFLLKNKDDDTIFNTKYLLFLTISYKFSNDAIHDKNLYFYAMNYNLHTIYLEDNMLNRTIQIPDDSKMYWFKHVNFMNSKILKQNMIGKNIDNVNFVLRIYQAQLKNEVITGSGKKYRKFIPYNVVKLKEIILPSEYNFFSIPHTKIFQTITEYDENTQNKTTRYVMNILLSNALFSIDVLLKERKNNRGEYEFSNILIENVMHIKKEPYIYTDKTKERTENIKIASIDDFEKLNVYWRQSEVMNI